ncbi:DUF3871 family protein [Robertkochia flava]|uniref:DUF3871 family protein n=1 Tax=Robertkochia flava TaxID=3447986 RepID=UPI001CCF70CC|nr:DUF3871 family protein [Robertkochia marina]
MTTTENTLMVPEREIVRSRNPNFIEANTKMVELTHLKEDCIIPVFSKDNESIIAHQEFVETAHECAQAIFSGQQIGVPDIRVSHVVKGRTPDAIGKPVKSLLDHEKTIYYERMMFTIEIPSITANVNGNELKLTLGGVRALNQENLYSRKTFEKFKFFVGFKNLVCTNLCVSSDGSVETIRASSKSELKRSIMDVIGNYEMKEHLLTLTQLRDFHLTEPQFAHFLGKAKMFGHLSSKEKEDVMSFKYSDSQLNSMTRAYYEDPNFQRNQDGTIDLWQFYNLMTGANKSSYIDSFIKRSVNAYEITKSLAKSIESNTPNWFLN